MLARRARPRAGTCPRTRAGASGPAAARTSRGRGRRRGRATRRRSAARRPRAGRRREAAARAPPARRGASARARAGGRRASRPPGDASRRAPREGRRAPAHPPPGRPGRRVPLASRGTLARGEHVVEEGKPAPDFELPSDSGEPVKLSGLRGKPVVLYFYPKDDTPGCTAQACGIRDAWGEFRRAGAVVLGVSPDDERSHVKFREKYDLPFPLLADTDHAIAEEYGVWKQKTFAGKSYMGVERSTFVIDADGTVVKELRRVKPDTHADDVLAALSS